MAGASDARPLLNRAAVQLYMPVELGGDAEEKPELCTRDGRGERWGQRTRGMRGCSCAERACAWSRRACAEACPQAGAHSPPEKSLLRNSLTEELSECRFKRRGEGYCSRTAGTNRKAVGLETCRVNPSHTNLLHHLSQKLFFLLVLLVQCLLWGAIHVNKLPRPSSHYYRP